MDAAVTAELDRRHARVREAMAAADLDVLVVSGSEYSGFEGSVTYLSGFQIVQGSTSPRLPATAAGAGSASTGSTTS
jgi:Xaa-Pro dipeptidase